MDSRARKSSSRLIIVGIDGSTDADHALRWATQLARTMNATVSAVQVCELESVLAQSEAHRSVALAVGRVLARSPGTPVLGDVLVGDPADCLVDASRNATMLVLGSHGRSRDYRRPIGSVAEACMQAAQCPVVVIPAPARVALMATVGKDMVSA